MKLLQLIVFLFTLASCAPKLYTPPKPVDISSQKYKDYLSNLKKARIDKNYYQEGLALANLRANPDSIYNKLIKSIYTDSTRCEEILRYEKYNRENDFQVVLIDVDTVQWNHLCKLCNIQISTNEFNEIEKKRFESYQNELAENPMDSSKLNWDLINELTKIEYDDQKFRKIRKNNENIISRNKLMNEMDSINLPKVVAILQRYGGYPAIEITGRDCALTIFLVLHHQGDMKNRNRYEHYLVEAVNDGNLKMSWLKAYKERSEHIYYLENK